MTDDRRDTPDRRVPEGMVMIPMFRDQAEAMVRALGGHSRPGDPKLAGLGAGELAQALDYFPDDCSKCGGVHTEEEGCP